MENDGVHLVIDRFNESISEDKSSVAIGIKAIK